MSRPLGYAVIDTETTGIHPGYHHRIAEIAVVHLDLDGQITDEWSTLVNPERDLGPQAIHGIRAADARKSPKFGQIVGQLVNRLRGRLPVAHNWHFDARHLKAEFARIGVETPFEAHSGLCTMAMARQALPYAGRSLIDCCRSARIQNTEWHSALADARAAALLLRHMMSPPGAHVRWTDAHLNAVDWSWPEYQVEPVELFPRTPQDLVSPHFLARVVDRIPRTGDPEADSYLALLDAALLDRHICDTEADSLVELAYDVGLSRAEVVDAHFGYLRAIARAAWMDGVVTDQERSNLCKVATLLGIDTISVDELLEREASRDANEDCQPGLLLNPHGLTLRSGLSVVLTGQMEIRREDWQTRAKAAGLIVSANVTKGTDLVVAADPDTASGKAKKARLYGIPVVSESAFAEAMTKMPSG